MQESEQVTTKVVQHEEAAHQKRNWVRLTFDCNDRCIFCLDSHTHDGTIRDRNEVRAQILDGRRKGAERLILSGGEPTIHPNFVDFVRLGRLAGYAKVQTVTNGRMFAYGDFLQRSIDAGLGEITFSIHGPNARIHDALVGTRGAFEEEMKGLHQALADGRVILNIDICVNRANVRHLPEMLEMFTSMGVLEFDLLHIIPFGRAYTEGKETLFYDLEEMRPYLVQAFEYARKPGVHVWLNRFPPAHVEGFEELIQDPYKLNDEVRGRQEEYATLLDRGIPLDCRAPQRCRHCYLEPLCDTLDDVREQVAARRFEIVRVDATWEGSLPPAFGGDPASSKRARDRKAPPPGERRRLPVLGSGGDEIEGAPVPVIAPERLAEEAGAARVWAVAPDLAAAAAAIAPYAGLGELELELQDYAGVIEALGDRGLLLGKRLRRVVCADVRDAEAFLAVAGDFEVVLDLTRRSADWIRAWTAAPPRLVLRQPTHERLTESAADDVDLRRFFGEWQVPVPVEGVPACVLGRPPRARPEHLDTAMMTPDGRVEIFRYTRRYIADRFMTKSLRCRACVYNEGCRGLHITHVRAHGYAIMQPVLAPALAGERPAGTA
ncbi:MAG: radical SAM protein [Nannocystaceae bacterium]